MAWLILPTSSPFTPCPGEPLRMQVASAPFCCNWVLCRVGGPLPHSRRMARGEDCYFRLLAHSSHLAWSAGGRNNFGIYIYIYIYKSAARRSAPVPARAQELLPDVEHFFFCQLLRRNSRHFFFFEFLHSLINFIESWCISVACEIAHGR